MLDILVYIYINSLKRIERLGFHEIDSLLNAIPEAFSKENSWTIDWFTRRLSTLIRVGLYTNIYIYIDTYILRKKPIYTHFFPL